MLVITATVYPNYRLIRTKTFSPKFRTKLLLNGKKVRIDEYMVNSNQIWNFDIIYFLFFALLIIQNYLVNPYIFDNFSHTKSKKTWVQSEGIVLNIRINYSDCKQDQLLSIDLVQSRFELQISVLDSLIWIRNIFP